MKFCPNCGAKLTEESLTYCLECGEELPNIAKKMRKRNRKKENETKNRKTEDAYDGYYDDRVPVDADVEREGIDKKLIRNVILVLVCVLLVILACVIILYTL